MALGNNPSQTDVIKAIRDLESSSGGGGVQSVTTGSTNGTLSVDGTDVSVYGLGSNAFNSTTIPTNYVPNNTSSTITGNSDTPLTLKSNTTSSRIAFKNSSNQNMGSYGVNSSGKPVFYDIALTTDKQLAYSSDVPTITLNATSGQESITVNSATLNFGSNAFNSTTIPTNTNQLVNGAGFITSSSVPSAGTTASAVGTSSSGGSASTYSKSDHVHNITSSTITSALGYTPLSSFSLSYGGSSGYGSITTSTSTIVTFNASTSPRIISFCVNTYNSGSQACDFYVMYAGSSTIYGGSSSGSSGTPSSSSTNYQMQMSTNARHNCKTLTFCIPANTKAYVYGRGTTTLSYNYFYTSTTFTIS